MAQAQFEASDSETIAENYQRDGFVSPIEIISPAEAKSLRDELEAAEAEFEDDPEKLAAVRTYPDRLLPSYDKIIRNEKLLDMAASVLGPDLIVWRASFFTKEPHSSKIVSWHQDLTYWGLDDAEEVTVWLALSPATVDSGCMRFVPGSHKEKIVPHVDTFSEDNLLSRGQELAVDVDESDAVDAELQPGQASMHHGHMFHASGPNRTGDRRIGLAIRYIKPSMKQQTGDRPLGVLVRGEDNYGHFTSVGSPKGRMTEEDLELCRMDTDIKRRVLYAGAEDAAGKRY